MISMSSFIYFHFFLLFASMIWNDSWAQCFSSLLDFLFVFVFVAPLNDSLYICNRIFIFVAFIVQAIPNAVSRIIELIELSCFHSYYCIQYFCTYIYNIELIFFMLFKCCRYSFYYIQFIHVLCSQCGMALNSGTNYYHFVCLELKIM